MRNIDSLLAEYATSHQKSLNIKIHYICVPAIFFSLIGLLACIPIPQFIIEYFPKYTQPFVHVGSLVIVLGLFYYLRLSIVLFICMLLFSTLVLFGIFYLEQAIPFPLWAAMLALFVIAWIGQFIGHKHEGKKPSFLKDIQFLMIGPAWTMSHLLKGLYIKY